VTAEVAAAASDTNGAPTGRHRARKPGGPAGSGGSGAPGGGIERSLSSRVAAATRWSLLNTVVIRVGNFALGVVLARYFLGPGEWGLYAVGLLVLNVLLSANEMGVSLAVVRWEGDVRRFAPTVLTLSFANSLLLYALLRGRLGRFMMALRDDPVGASSRGIDVVRTKSIAFCVSCALCGLAGSLYGTFSQLVSPELGLLQQTGLVLAMVVIGGMSSLTGAVAGALLVYLSSEWMRGFGNVQIIVFALLVIVFARYLPGGLWGLVAGRLQGGRP